MNKLKLILIAFLSLFVGGLRDQFATANTEGLAGIHHGRLTRIADATNIASFTAQHLLVMAGSDADHFQCCDGAHMPIGSTDDQPTAAGSPYEINIFGNIPRTVLLQSVGAIAEGADLYADPANPGFVTGEPAVAGTYYLVGRAAYTAQENADGNYTVESEVFTPKVVVVVAAITSAQNATDTLVGLQASYNALQTDFAALVAALNHGGIFIKHL